MPVVPWDAKAAAGPGRPLGDDRRRGADSIRSLEVERQKYVCACGGAVETAPGPVRAIDGGRYSLRFAIKVAFDKYVAHLPLERAGALDGASRAEHHLADAVGSVLGGDGAARADLRRALRAASSQPRHRRRPDRLAGSRGHVAAAVADVVRHRAGLVYHRICDDKSARTFKDLLGDYRGWVVADALGSHEAGARECRGLKLAACWAHVLRRFRDAVVDFSEAQFMLAWIQDLYAIDARATDTRDRARLRSTESRAVTEKMKAWMQSATALKTTTLGSAIRYTLGIWSRLTLFLDDPEIWLDNNRTERGLRGPVIGRRNHFGSKSARGTVVAATMYSLVESAKASAYDPIAYLAEVATRAQRTPSAVLLPADLRAATPA